MSTLPCSPTRGPKPVRVFAALTLVGLIAACGSDSSDGDSDAVAESAVTATPVALPDVPVALPDVIEIAPPASSLGLMGVVENMSEDVANRLVELAPLFRVHDLAAATEWFTPDFAGHGPDTAPARPAQALPLGARRVEHDPAGCRILGREDWLASFDALLAGYGVLDSVVFKVKGAEFDRGGLPRGTVRLKISLFGLGSDGRPISKTLWALAEVRKPRDAWLVHRFQLQSLTVLDRDQPVFADITVGAGVANQTTIFGKDGHTTFYWNGAASHDVDGDGLWDLFVPSTERSFLFHNQGDGTFKDVSRAWGLEADSGGTGCVFTDIDSDGDPDLIVAHVGWTDPDGSPGGQTLRFYRNEGDRFVDATEGSGFDRGRHAAFSLVAADFDTDGHTDVYVCSYNRMDVEYPESWYHAENGTPNALYRNKGDGTFENVAAAWGADDGRWTFAAAAADHDSDGDLDLYLANDYGDNALLENRLADEGRFVDVAAAKGLTDTGNGMATAWGDLDTDGTLDLYVANMASTAGNRILGRLVPEDTTQDMGDVLLKLAGGNSIFKRTPGGDYERLPSENGATGASWAWSSVLVDADLDADLDVIVANGFISGESAADT